MSGYCIRPAGPHRDDSRPGASGGGWLGCSFVVWIFCIVGGVRVFYRLRARGWKDTGGILVAVLAGLGLFMGGWLGYIPYLMVRGSRRGCVERAQCRRSRLRRSGRASGQPPMSQSGVDQAIMHRPRALDRSVIRLRRGRHLPTRERPTGRSGARLRSPWSLFAQLLRV
jgi:hypothetical protein